MARWSAAIAVSGRSANSVEEPALDQDVTRRPARLSGRDGTPREIAMGDGAIDPDRAHRRAARARREAEHAEEQ